MTNNAWHAAKMTALGMGLVVASALVSGGGLVHRPGHESDRTVATPAGTARSASSPPAGATVSVGFGAGGGARYGISESTQNDRQADAPCMWSRGFTSSPCAAAQP